MYNKKRFVSYLYTGPNLSSKLYTKQKIKAFSQKKLTSSLAQEALVKNCQNKAKVQTDARVQNEIKHHLMTPKLTSNILARSNTFRMVKGTVMQII